MLAAYASPTHGTRGQRLQQWELLIRYCCAAGTVVMLGQGKLDLRVIMLE
jgi:hypothetical protein